MQTSSSISLVAFEPTHPLRVEARWQLAAPRSATAARTLRLRFEVYDPDEVVIWPASSQAPAERDGLWKHSCMELFIGQDGADSYGELNVSPSGDWAFYYFAAYRQRQAIVGPAPAPMSIFVEGDATSRSVSFEVELRRLRDLIGEPPWRWQPTAVLETSSGLTYWAPSHPATRPDFHRLGQVPVWDPYDEE
jgi:hypothetical protein